MTATTSPEGIDWRKKYDITFKKYIRLKQLTNDLVTNYETAAEKVEEKELKIKQLEERVGKRENELNQVRILLEPLINDYHCLQDKLESGERLRMEAVDLASRLHNENRKLKRQSQNIIAIMNNTTEPHVIQQVMEIPLDESDEKENEILSSLNCQIKTLDQDLKEMKTKYEAAEKDSFCLRDQIAAYQVREQEMMSELESKRQLLAEYEDVSRQAIDQIKQSENQISLQKKQNMELNNQNLQVKSENDILKRQSQKLTSMLPNPEVVMEDLITSDNLLHDIADKDRQIRVLNEEIEELKESLKTSKAKIEELRHGNELLRHSIDLAKAGNTTSIPAPPTRAPPPPPPPPPPPSFLSRFLNPSSWKKQPSTTTRQVPKKDPQRDLMKELREQIERRKASGSVNGFSHNEHRPSEQTVFKLESLLKPRQSPRKEDSQSTEQEPEFLSKMSTLRKTADRSFEGSSTSTPPAHGVTLRKTSLTSLTSMESSFDRTDPQLKAKLEERRDRITLLKRGEAVDDEGNVSEEPGSEKQP